MELGMVGLGRMGSNMVERLLEGGHRLVGYTRTSEKVNRIVQKGAEGAHSLEELVSKLYPRRAVWLMIPPGDPVDKTIEALIPHLDKKDVIIDGGNSLYKDTQRRADRLKQKNLHFVDAGTSGGIWGRTEGSRTVPCRVDLRVGALEVIVDNDPLLAEPNSCCPQTVKLICLSEFVMVTLIFNRNF